MSGDITQSPPPSLPRDRWSQRIAELTAECERCRKKAEDVLLELALIMAQIRDLEDRQNGVEEGIPPNALRYWR